MNLTAERSAQKTLDAAGERQAAGLHRTPPTKRVVAGVDGSAGSVAALLWATAEACRRGAALHIVSVWEDPPPAQPGPARSDSPAQIAAQRVQRALERVLDDEHHPGEVICAWPKGDPGQVLLEAAEDADLVVVGTTGISTVRIPGPMGLYCLRHAKCPVVFVPGPSGC